ncbi:MAG: hypothetical protein ACRDGK_04290 [Actinomycetota bacterium]
MLEAKFLCFGCGHPLAKHREVMYGPFGLSLPKKAKITGCSVPRCTCENVQTKGTPTWGQR